MSEINGKLYEERMALTAAREREEKLVLALRQIRGTPGNIAYHRDMACDALDAYDVSRAAIKEGA